MGQESWYEKLGRWEEALEAYDKKLRSLQTNRKSASYLQALLGRLRCSFSFLSSRGP